MLELLAGFAFWQFLLLIFILIGGVAGIILLINKLKIPLRISNRGGGSFSLNDRQREASLKEKLNIQKKDLLIIMGKVAEVTAKQIDIKKVETLNNQMTFVEDKIGDLRTFFDAKFVETLKKVLSPDKLASISLNEDLRKYTLVVKGALDKIVNSFRTSCRINHFDDYEEGKFLYYAERKSASYLAIITDAINDNYILTKAISPEEIIKINNVDVYPKVKEILISFFSNARKISNNSSSRIKELDFFLLDFITSYLDVDISKEERETFVKNVDTEGEKEFRKKMLERY